MLAKLEHTYAIASIIGKARRREDSVAVILIGLKNPFGEVRSIPFTSERFLIIIVYHILLYKL